LKIRSKFDHKQLPEPAIMGKAMNLQEVKFCRKQGLEQGYIEKMAWSLMQESPVKGKPSA